MEAVGLSLTHQSHRMKVFTENLLHLSCFPLFPESNILFVSFLKKEAVSCYFSPFLPNNRVFINVCINCLQFLVRYLLVSFKVFFFSFSENIASLIVSNFPGSTEGLLHSLPRTSRQQIDLLSCLEALNESIEQ